MIEIIYENEDHTLGSLLQYYLLRDSNVIYAGYKVSEDRKMTLKYNLKDPSIDTLNLVKEKIKNDIQLLRSEINLN